MDDLIVTVRESCDVHILLMIHSDFIKLSDYSSRIRSFDSSFENKDSDTDRRFYGVLVTRHGQTSNNPSY